VQRDLPLRRQETSGHRQGAADRLRLGIDAQVERIVQDVVTRLLVQQRTAGHLARVFLRACVTRDEGGGERQRQRRTE
jgi:hypothetical protein